MKTTSFRFSWMRTINPFQRRRRSPKEITKFGLLDGPRPYTWEELAEATQNFSPHSLLGEGGYGEVYRAAFSSGSEAAVKVIINEAGMQQRSFAAELSTLGNLHHRNLVQFKGWCFTKTELFVVYDYMPNKSLDTHLFSRHHRDGYNVLSWSTRCHIARGVAQGLVYLHDVEQVVHRDIKAANVLLDSDFNAHISDFGLARCMFARCSNVIRPGYSSIFHDVTLGDGSLGYTAPECIGTKAQPTPMSDVFSFGVLLFEILSAREAFSTSGILLVDWIHSLFSKNQLLDALDPQLTISGVETEEVLGLFNLGLQCIQLEAAHRPTMNQVLARLHDLPKIVSPLTKDQAYLYEAILSSSMLDIRTVSSSLLKEEEGELNLEHCSSLVRVPQAFPWKDIVVATRNFETVIGTRGTCLRCTHYHGKAFGQDVSVKIWKLSGHNSPLRRNQMDTELQFLGNIRHANILTLVGWSSNPKRSKYALVYDYMPNGSLQDWLGKEERVLPWNLRFRIAKELGAALFHLHENCHAVPIIHRDVKPRNLLLDSEFHVRLADLGLGLALKASSMESPVCGTIGYIAPEYLCTGVATKDTDVFAYGVVLLQLVSGEDRAFDVGRMANYESVMITDRAIEGLVSADIKLEGNYDELELNMLLGLGLLCICKLNKDRPDMKRVLDILDFKVPLDSPLSPDDDPLDFQNDNLDFELPPTWMRFGSNNNISFSI